MYTNQPTYLSFDQGTCIIDGHPFFPLSNGDGEKRCESREGIVEEGGEGAFVAH